MLILRSPIPESISVRSLSLIAGPTFLMWGTNTPIFVVECKGSQTSRSSVITQLRRGLEQLTSISIPGVQRVDLVIATHLSLHDMADWVGHSNVTTTSRYLRTTGVR